MNLVNTFKRIPNDWQLKKLREILVEAKLGGNYENAEANDGIPVIKMGNLDRGKIKVDKIQCLPTNEGFNKGDVLKKGDLLFNTRNTLDLVGKVAIWRNELPLAIFNSNLMRMKFDERFVTSNWFMNYAFNSHYGLSQLRGIATGTTSVAAIYGRDLETIKFLLPPLLEQKKIAEILSTWDKAIETAVNLLTSKQTHKRALMQRLLTGKQRFPQFAGQVWKKLKISSFTKAVSRVKPKPSELFTALGIRSHGKGTFLKENFEPQKIDMTELYEVKANDLIVNITFAWEGAIAIVKETDEGALVSHRFPTYEFDLEKAIPEFFKYIILQKWFVKKLGLISPGGAGRNRVMSKTDFGKLEVTLPSVKEQKRIAEVLMACDKEIELLERERDAMKKQKRGLMQKLLTGKIRVKVDLVEAKEQGV